MFGQWLCVLVLLAVSTSVLAHDPQPQKPWWCRFANRFSRSCNSNNNPSNPSNPSNPTNPSNPPGGNNNNNNQCCPTGGIWGAWKVKTTCTDTCGAFGTQTMERTCLTESTCGPCSGSSTKENVRCNFTPCQYPRNSCNTGYKAAAKGSQILCTGPPEPVETVQKASCCPVNGLMDTTEWTSCNGAQCGSCTTQTRTKTCASKPYGCDCTEQDQTESRPCQTGPCKFPQDSCCSGFKAKAVSSQILCV